MASPGCGVEAPLFKQKEAGLQPIRPEGTLVAFLSVIPEENLLAGMTEKKSVGR